MIVTVTSYKNYANIARRLPLKPMQTCYVIFRRYALRQIRSSVRYRSKSRKI
jgi:hypothetical protein